MAMQEVEFTVRGVTVRGDLYLPDDVEGPVPAVVMAGGWCYVKELRQPDYAKEFIPKGMAALIFDYRCMGASDGEPRQHINPWDQIEDYKGALSYLEGRPDIDPDRLAAWGISYSGGHVIILGATDPRVKCIVANVPVIHGYDTMWRVHGTERFRMLKDVIAEERRKHAQTGEWGYLPMSGPVSEGLASWPLDEVRVVFEELRKTQAPRHEHRNTIASVEHLLEYDVNPYPSRIVDTPTLMIVAEGDDITCWDQEINVFNNIATPKKKLLVLPATSHMVLYSNLTALELAAKAAANFFEEHLLNPPTVASVLGQLAAG